MHPCSIKGKVSLQENMGKLVTNRLRIFPVHYQQGLKAIYEVGLAMPLYLLVCVLEQIFYFSCAKSKDRQICALYYLTYHGDLKMFSLKLI